MQCQKMKIDDQGNGVLLWLTTLQRSLCLWKEQEFKIVEVWPPLKMKNKVGHTSSTILNSCSFQRHIEYILKYLCICVTIHSKKDIFSLIVRGKLGSKTYQYFIFLFFTLSVERGRGMINDAIFTLSAVFSFWWLP